MVKSGSKKTIFADSYLSSGKLRSRITVSKDLERYFRHFEFWSHYDTEISASNSILNIPVLSILLPFAWVTGADVYVDELDRTFAESMDVVHREFQRIYNGLPFKTRLVSDSIVDNEYASDGTALLFSGGLDSTYSLFSNLALKPRLVMIFGTSDIPISNIAFQKSLRREYLGLAEREGLTLNFIRTNMQEILDIKRVDHLFGSLSSLQARSDRCIWTDHWPQYWDAIGYSLAHIGQAAPLSIGRFRRLIAAGWWTCALSLDELKTHKMKYTDSEYAAAKIAWGNLRVKQDGNIHRHEKTIFLKQFADAHRLKLRVCLECCLLYSQRMQSPHLTQLNCNHCGKCLMTIAECALAGINPNECGFVVDQSTYHRIPILLAGSGWEKIARFWKPLQQAILEETELDLHGSREFFVWLKRLNIDSMLSRLRPFCSPLSSIYHTLPYPIANILRIVMENTPAWRLRYHTDLALARPQQVDELSLA